jgi:hypothetical protein
VAVVVVVVIITITVTTRVDNYYVDRLFYIAFFLNHPGTTSNHGLDELLFSFCSGCHRARASMRGRLVHF